MAFGTLLGTASNTTGSGSSISTTSSLTVSVGDLVIASYGERAVTSVPTFSDNLNNTWNSLTNSATTSLYAAWSKITTSGSMTAKVVCTTSFSNTAILIASQFQGPFAASPQDANPAVAAALTTNATGTLAQATELVVGYGSGRQTTAMTSSNAPFVVSIQASSSEASAYALSHASAVVSSTSSIACTWVSGSVPGAGIVSFKAAATTLPYLAEVQYYDRPADPVRLLRDVVLDTWQASYFLGQIAKDQMTTAFRKESYDLPNPIPIEPYPYRSWTFTYNWGDLSKDAMTTAFRKESYELPPRAEVIERNPYRSWEYVNVEYIGKDRVPNLTLFDIPQADPEPNPRRYWEFNNTKLIGKDAVPAAKKEVYDLPPIGSEPNPRRSWEWMYNLNLISKDQMPTAFRKEFYDLPPIAAEPNPRRSWEYSYNKNLISKDQIPNLVFIDKTEPVIWYQDWNQNLQLTTLAVVLRPKNQLDWPLPGSYPRLDQTFIGEYTLGLIGKDNLPNLSQVDRPDPVYWYQDWNQNLQLSTLSSIVAVFPRNQKDWPLPGVYPRLDETFVGRYNFSLKDQVPNLTQVGLPDPVVWYLDWNQNLQLTTLSSLGVVVLPRNQTDWPNPYPVNWYKDWSIRSNYLKDQVPNLTQIDRPDPVVWYQDWNQNLLQNTLTSITAVVLPRNQTDWPLPIVITTLPFAWTASYNKNLIGKDVLPNVIQGSLPDQVTWSQSWFQLPQLPYPVTSIPTSITVIAAGRVPKDYPHTWLNVPPEYRYNWAKEMNKLIVHEAAVRLGTKGGIASGKSRRR